MSDLKERLRALDEQPMPDRWDRIQRRPVEPVAEPRRSRAGAMVTAGLVAAVVVGMVALLLPLGTKHTNQLGGAEGQPPRWLVDAAYRMAYENGDITPRSAEWVLSDANTIAPAIGLASGNSSRQEYLVVLRGDFTGYGAKVPAGGSLPTGTYLTAAFDPRTQQVTDWGIGNQRPDVPGLEPFEMPPAASTARFEQGGSIAIPPSWKVSSFAELVGSSPHGIVVSNHGLSLPVTTGRTGYPEADQRGFPSNGVTLIIATMDGVVPRVFTPPSSPPLSTGDFVSAPSPGATIGLLVFAGPDGRFSATFRIGADASEADRSALSRVVASLTFQPQPTTESTATRDIGLPTTDAVVDDRFVTSIQLDGGGLRVDPAPADVSPPVPRSSVEDEMWASPVFQGDSQSVLGFGLVTLAKAKQGVQAVTSEPAWIAFGWGATYHCPNLTVAPSHIDVPSPGYTAVVIPSNEFQSFSYQAASAPCGNLIETKVLQATHIESVAWHQKGPVTGGKITITYTPTPCGTDPVFSIAGDPTGSTLTVEVAVPDASLACPSPLPTTKAVDVYNGATHLEHAPTGFVRQI